MTVSNDNEKVVFEAIKFAAEAHYGHYRKGSEVPYMAHLMSVARILASNGFPEEVVAAGILHDVLEDTPVTPAALQEAFGKEITEMVLGASEEEKINPEPNRQYSWRERKEGTIRYLRDRATPPQLAIAAADKLDNIRSTRMDVEKIGDKVWERFRAGAEQQQWYFQSLLAVFQEKAQQQPNLQPIADEMAKEVKAVFRS